MDRGRLERVASPPMKTPARSLVRGAMLVAVLALPTVALAQEAARPRTFDVQVLLYGVVSTTLYGWIGIVLTMIGYRVFAWMLPFDVKKELEEDHNMSVGVLLAALVLGICLVVAATIHS